MSDGSLSPLDWRHIQSLGESKSQCEATAISPEVND
jgi:hypothetical protein